LLLGVVGLLGERPGVLLLGVVGLLGELSGLLLVAEIWRARKQYDRRLALSASSKTRSPDWLKP
jgi:hypothetical protein